MIFVCIVLFGPMAITINIFSEAEIKCQYQPEEQKVVKIGSFPELGK